MWKREDGCASFGGLSFGCQFRVEAIELTVVVTEQRAAISKVSADGILEAVAIFLSIRDERNVC